MIDSLLEHLDTARTRRSWEQFGIEAGGYALVTLHRPALVDDSSTLRGHGRADRARRRSAGASRSTRGRCATSRRPVTTTAARAQA